MAETAILYIKNLKFVTVGMVEECLTASPCQMLWRWAIGQTVPEISRYLDFFKMATAAILDFTFLTVGTVKKVELRHPAKFLRNRPNRGPDMAIFAIFKDGGHAISDF